MMWWLVFCVAAQVSGTTDQLILTDFIASGDAEEGKQSARVLGVHLYPQVVTSYSGFFRVTQYQNRSLFFWYFPCENSNLDKPVVLWLEGDPGKSSTLGVFSGVGPYFINDGNTAVTYNIDSWTKEFNVLFIDSPVGAGFSFVETVRGYVSDMNDVAKHLYNALTQFFTVFPELRNLPFYIAGGHFAAKYATALTTEIDNLNPTTANKINLQGLILASPYLDANFHVKSSGLLRQFGLLNEVQYHELREKELAISNLVNEGSTIDAYQQWESYMYTTLAKTRLESLYNIVEGTYNVEDKVRIFLDRAFIRDSLHVGNQPFGSSSQEATVKRYLRGDILRSAKNDLEFAAYNHRLLFVTGNMDPISPPVLTEQFLNDFEFNGTTVYRGATTQLYRFNGRVEGYKKNTTHLYSVILRNCGHFIFKDCAYKGRDVVVRFAAQTL